MYQALYRKWRPRTFDDVSGQDAVVETLRRQVAQNRTSHAYLFTGTRGTGKTTCAKLFARAVNCEHPVNGNPCNKCPSCIGIENGSIMDVVEMDAASNNGVDDVRELRSDAVYSPTTVKKRVYIIDEVHMLSAPAFNALLKIMEEPPEHLIFILATTELHKVPATVLSRCQRFTFKRLRPETIAARLSEVAKAEGLELTDEAAALLSQLADGAMRDGLSLLDQCSSNRRIDTEQVLTAIGLAGREETERLMRATLGHDAFTALTLLDKLYTEGKDVGSVLEELCTLERDVLITKIAPTGGTGLLSGSFDAEPLKKMSSLTTAPELMRAIETIRGAASDMRRGGGGKTAAELCLLRLCGAQAAESGEAGYSEETTLTQAPAQTEKTAVPESPKAEESVATPAPGIPKPAPGPDGSLADILEAVKPELDVMDYIVLCDPVHAVSEVGEGVLTIRAKSPFALNTLDRDYIKAALAAACERVLGRRFSIVVTDAPVAAAGREKDPLDTLDKFDNIIFK